MAEVLNVQKAVEIERSADEKKAIAQLKKQLFEELKKEREHDDIVESSRLKIGTLLEDARTKKAWQDWGHSSWNDFLESIAPQLRKGRTSLYNYAATARDLLPYIPPDELPEVGITKARVLAAAVKKSGGKRPSDTLLNAAKSPAISVEDMHQLIADNFGARDETEKGTWFSLGGVFFSEEERDEFKRAVDVACRVDPPLKTVIDWNDANAPDRKEVLQRFVREFLGTYEAEVSGPKDEVFGE